MCYRAAPMSAARKPSSRKSAASSSTAKKSAAKRKSPKKTTSKNARKATTSQGGAAKAAGKKKTTTQATDRARTRKPSTRAARAKPARAARATKKSSARSGARPRAHKLDRKALAKIRADLLEERRNYESQISELEEESFQGTQSELTGDVAIDEDFADAGSATFDREQALSIYNNITDLIDQVDRALSRIDDGTYGSCERCGRPIDAARLKALPRTLLCQDCKRREERAR